MKIRDMSNIANAKTLVKEMAELSNLSISKKEELYFPEQFTKTLKVIDELNKLDTSKVEGTYNVTGLSDVFRKDEIDETRILTQKEALSNSKNSHNGFFVVKAIFDEK